MVVFLKCSNKLVPVMHVENSFFENILRVGSSNVASYLIGDDVSAYLFSYRIHLNIEFICQDPFIIDAYNYLLCIIIVTIETLF